MRRQDKIRVGDTVRYGSRSRIKDPLNGEEGIVAKISKNQAVEVLWFHLVLDDGPNFYRGLGIWIGNLWKVHDV